MSASTTVLVTPAFIAADVMSFPAKNPEDQATVTVDASALGATGIVFFAPPGLTVSKVSGTASTIMLAIAGGAGFVYRIAFTVTLPGGAETFYVSQPVAAASGATSPAPVLSNVPTKVSQLANDSRYLTPADLTQYASRDDVGSALAEYPQTGTVQQLIASAVAGVSVGTGGAPLTSGAIAAVLGYTPADPAIVAVATMTAASAQSDAATAKADAAAAQAAAASIPEPVPYPALPAIIPALTTTVPAANADGTSGHTTVGALAGLLGTGAVETQAYSSLAAVTPDATYVVPASNAAGTVSGHASVASLTSVLAPLVAALLGSTSISTGTTATPAITVTPPSAPIAGMALTFALQFSPAFGSMPALSYSVDSAAAAPLPSTATITTSSASFAVTGLPAGPHTVKVTGPNGSASATVPFTVSQVPVITITPPTGLQVGQVGTATVQLLSTTVLPGSFSIDGEAPTAIPPSSITNLVASIPIPATLDIGTHYLQFVDANGVSTAEGVCAFNVAPVTSGQFAAPGVPIYGPGMFDYVEGSSWASNYDKWVANSGHIPKINLAFDSFDSIESTASHYEYLGRIWAADGRANGTLHGVAPLIPVAAVNMWYTNAGDLNFDSVLTGQFDAQIARCLTGWKPQSNTVMIRLGWEINIPTTPAGVDAQNGQFPGNLSHANSDDADYILRYIKAFRYMSHLLQVTAAANGMTVLIIWEAAHIGQCDIDPRMMYPDSRLRDDNYGQTVHIIGQDRYDNNGFGAVINYDNQGHAKLFDGYEKAPPFSVPVQTGTGTTVQAFHNEGSELAFAVAPDGNFTNFASFSGGYGFGALIELARTAPFGPLPIMNPEMGLVTSLDGGHNGGLTVAAPYNDFNAYSDGGPSASPVFARTLRQCYAYAHSVGVPVIGGCNWYYWADLQAQTFAGAFPECTAAWSGPKVSQVATPAPCLKILTPEQSLQVGVAFPMIAGWTGHEPQTITISENGGAARAPANIQVNSNGTLFFDYTPTVAGVVTLTITDPAATQYMASTQPIFVKAALIAAMGSTTAGLGTNLTASGAVFTAPGAWGAKGLSSLTAPATVQLTNPAGPLEVEFYFQAPPPPSGNAVGMGGVTIITGSATATDYCGIRFDKDGFACEFNYGSYQGRSPSTCATGQKVHVVFSFQADNYLYSFVNGRQFFRSYIGQGPANAILWIESPGGLATISEVVVRTVTKYPGVQFPFRTTNKITYALPTGAVGVGDPSLIAVYRLNNDTLGGAAAPSQYLNNVNGGEASTPLIAAMQPGANPFRVTAKIQPASLAAGAQFIMAQWTAGGTDSNTSWTFYLDGGGALNLGYMRSGQAYTGSASTVPLPASITSAPLWVRATINPMTGALLYETSPDRATWTTLGAAVTNGQTGPVVMVATNNSLIVGGQQGAGNSFVGRIYEVELEVNGAIVSDLALNGQTAGASSVSDAQGHVYTISGGSALV